MATAHSTANSGASDHSADHHHHHQHAASTASAAADLLRQSLLHGKIHDDDAHDHIGSGANTPPGAMTPRPDLLDKRLPGIINSYFGQVCASSPADPATLSSSSSSTTTSAPPPSAGTTLSLPPPPPPPQDTSVSPTRRHPLLDTSSSPSASHSTVRPPAHLPVTPRSPFGAPNAGAPGSPPTLQLGQASLPGGAIPLAYPTPPVSGSSSMRQKYSDAASNDARDLEKPGLRRSWTGPATKIASLTSALRRRVSLSVAPRVVTKPAISAHISNPANDMVAMVQAGSRPAPSDALPSPTSISSSKTDDRDTKLTNGLEPAQSTPPQTPRSFSGDGVPHHSLSKAIHMRRSSSNTSHNPTIGQMKGQLEVCVQEGRGLRPSVEPYVVCIFQLNEDISGGPKADAMDTADHPHPHMGGAGGEENLARGVAMRRIGSGSGTPIAIPGLRSRQTSQTNIAELRRGSKDGPPRETTDPVWRHMATFDVVGENNEIDISVYDRNHNETFIGHVRLPLALDDYEHQHEGWYKLQSREGEADHVSGEIRLKIAFKATGKKVFRPDDFEILRLIGKGTFGQVFQVRKKDTKRIYAMKVLSKKLIVQKKEIQHTIGERNILVRTATSESPFIVGLKFSFQTSADLYLVTDYMSGGELFWHLQREGRFMEDRAKFYIAELILALRHLHQHDIVYRDLKPENILLDANGHIALCDFGLSKANLAKNDTTNTFCGTTEYLAPEVLLDEQGYTKMVDFWSLGVLVFEMCCGWSPFYADDTQQMYKNIAFGKVRFPRDALSQEGRNFVKGLLNRNPSHRLGARGDAEELMAHPFFADIDWDALSKKMTQPPFKPKLKGELDVSNFDPEFTNALNDQTNSSLNARAAALASGINNDSTPLSPTMQNQFKGFTFVDESTLEQQFSGRDDDDNDDMDGLDDNAANGHGSTSRGFSSRAGDRMSGIEGPMSAGADGDFNHGMLDDL